MKLPLEWDEDRQQIWDAEGEGLIEDYGEDGEAHFNEEKAKFIIAIVNKSKESLQ